VQEKLPERFTDESLANHWLVDKSPESFRRLTLHLEEKTNFLPFFKEATNYLFSNYKFEKKLTIADLGCGVGWTSSFFFSSLLPPRHRAII
jgi:hypothetical protein